MDFRVLFASFALVFLAELGDKTQLTALAFTTSSRSPWMVFFGTSLALVAASAMAVLFGEALNRIPVVQKYLPIVSGAMFILMGLVLLVNVARKAEAPAAGVPTPGGSAEVSEFSPPATGGALFSLIVGQAATLEAHALGRLEDIHRELPAGERKNILAEIIGEDRRHLGTLEEMPREHADSFDAEDAAITASQFSQLRNTTALFAEETPASEVASLEAAEKLRRAMETEEAIAETYLAFARIAKVHAVRDAFRWLAMEEIRHAHRLCDLVNPGEETEERFRV